MASSSSSPLAPLSGSPPTPTSLLGLPEPWLLKLETCKGLDGQSDALLALFRTCTFFRDAVARRRTASASFNVPIDAEDFPAEVERLCAVARRSSNVRLHFHGPEACYRDGPVHSWKETEPNITHLLVRAKAKLGRKPLACVKEIKLEGLEQTSLVPASVKVLCPNATKLDMGRSTEIVVSPLHHTMPHPHLQHLSWEGNHDSAHVADHVRQQLAALPSLTSLSLRNLSWAQQQDEQQSRRLISSTVTRLQLTAYSLENIAVLQRLRTHFPFLRELDVPWFEVDDAALEQLLSLPHLEHLSVRGFSLQVNRVTRHWPSLTVHELDVGSFACLPLDDIAACSGWGLVRPSADAVAVARVAQAVSRWGGAGNAGAALTIDGEDFEALLTTLGPLLSVLSVEEQRQVIIRGDKEVTAQELQELGQHLPAGVTTLRLDYWPSPDACAALLPSLPATVEELRLGDTSDREQEEVLALCQAAVRPIRVVLKRYCLSEQDLEGVRDLLVGPEQQPSLVTLVVDLDSSDSSEE